MAERPKRRKYRDNPYTLMYCEENNSYVVQFRNSNGEMQIIEVKEEIFKILDRFELDDIKT